MLPHSRCASMPALPLWACIDVRPPTALHCRCAEMLAFPQCPTMAVKSVFKICVTLKICAFGFSSWRVGVGSASAVRPHTAAWQHPGLAFTAHVFGWGRGGGLADGFGTGVWAAPDARPDAGAGAGLAGACGACRGAGSEPGRAARKTRGRALRNRPQINYRSVARRGMQPRG